MVDRTVTLAVAGLNGLASARMSRRASPVPLDTAVSKAKDRCSMARAWMPTTPTVLVASLQRLLLVANGKEVVVFVAHLCPKLWN
jgi:hypothetical protein